jgi:phosphoribosylglycinamide formyltransferase-1
MNTFRIAIFASGNGTNAEAIINYFKSHRAIKVVLLLSNNEQAFALQRVKNLNVAAKTFTRQQFRESDEVINWLREFEVSHIVLAGFLWLIPKNLIERFPRRIINIHPALLPKFGGKGMYGLKVHEAVKASGDLQTGITIHEVNDQYDEGKILFQAACEVSPGHFPEDIANQVHELEHLHYPRVIENWILENSTSE